MKKSFVLFAAMAVTFLVSEDLHSSNNGAGNNSRETVEYCVYNWNEGFCHKSSRGDACYLVDENCQWLDDQPQPEA